MNPLLRQCGRRWKHRIKHRFGGTTRCVSLRTNKTEQGTVLLAYILEPFRNKERNPICVNHTHYIESLLIAKSYLGLGYNVDVIDYGNAHFYPRKEYAIFVSARTNLEKISERLNKDCAIVAHLDTSHFAFNNRAAYERVLSLQERRGICCPSIRIIEHNAAIERADYGIVLGNESTLKTYRYANTPLQSVAVPSPVTYPFLRRQYGTAKKNFMWFGSEGFVHKGLDLTLEAFAKMPDLNLYVCGPVKQDKRFCRMFEQELFNTPNIRTVGWQKIDSPEFKDLLTRCVALVYPSCAEGQAGAAVVCAHGGLIPLVSAQSGLNVTPFGTIFHECSVDEIQSQVRRIATMEDEQLEAMSKETWLYARRTHTTETYIEKYQQVIRPIQTHLTQTESFDVAVAVGGS